MRVAVVFDTPYPDWDHPDHQRQMELEIAVWKENKPEMEYQIAHALRERGHDVRLLGVRDDLEYLVRYLSEWEPDLVFNGAEAFRGDESLEYLLPRLLEAEGYPYTGAPPLALQVTRNKAISTKVLAYFGIQVPAMAEEFVDGRELYVSIIGNDDAAAKAGMEYSDFIHRIVEAAVAPYERA